MVDNYNISNVGHAQTINFSSSGFTGASREGNRIQIHRKPIQDLAEVVEQIGQITKQVCLEEPTTTTEKMLAAAKVIEVIENTPALRKQLTEILHRLGKEALENTIDHPVGKLALVALATEQRSDT